MQHRARRALVVLGTAALTVVLSVTPSVGSPAQSQAQTSGPAGSVVRSPAQPAEVDDILDRISQVPGVHSVTERTAPTGYRFFTMTFTQPVDHARPNGATFDQRITLLHKDVSRPMVMYTSGYYVSQSAGRSEPTRIVDGNQLSMEYRFFDPSRPADPEWDEQLTVKQAAADQHRIIVAFKQIYRQKWITTGGSKGGMTATYHRRFYPNDVAGTVPYVAPNDVVDSSDVYNDFLDRVGTSQACRDALTDVQRRVLGADRQWFLDRTNQDAEANGYTWNVVGDMEKAWESSVVDAYFAFWQYSLQSDCASVPTRTATNEEVYQWYEQVSPMTVYADQSVEYYTPYYYQAAYQLGSPEPYENRIHDLLHFPGSDVALTFVPANLQPIKFDRRAMPDVDKWVRSRSARMLYVYGGNDPWGAEPFTCGKKKQATKRSCFRYFVAGGNHGSNISQLPTPDRQFATEQLLKWAGLGARDEAARQIERVGHPRVIGSLDKPDRRQLGVTR